MPFDSKTNHSNIEITIRSPSKLRIAHIYKRWKRTPEIKCNDWKHCRKILSKGADFIRFFIIVKRHMYRNGVGARDDRLCVVKYIRSRRRRRYPDRKKTSKESYSEPDEKRWRLCRKDTEKRNIGVAAVPHSSRAL